MYLNTRFNYWYFCFVILFSYCILLLYSGYCEFLLWLLLYFAIVLCIVVFSYCIATLCECCIAILSGYCVGYWICPFYCACTVNDVECTCPRRGVDNRPRRNVYNHVTPRQIQLSTPPLLSLISLQQVKNYIKHGITLSVLRGNKASRHSEPLWDSQAFSPPKP